MSENIILIGAEDVRRAGGAMSGAADDISRAAGSFSDTVEQLRRVLDEHAGRIEEAMKPAQPAPTLREADVVKWDGCGSSNCLINPPRGQHVDGRCRCAPEKVLQYITALKAALNQPEKGEPCEK